MIFAAGLGTRLAPYTERHPKALVEVDGKPMLEHVIRHVLKIGINDLVVNVHHFPNQIVEFLRQNNNFGANIIISDESALLLDTGGALLHAAPLLKRYDRILIHNADILTDVSLTEMLNFHNRSEGDATLLTFPRKSSRQLYFDTHTNRLIGWRNIKTGQTLPENFSPSGQDQELAFGGVHVISPTIIEELERYAPAGTPFSIIPYYINACSNKKIISFKPSTPFKWFDIGSPEKLELARQKWNYISNQ